MNDLNTIWVYLAQTPLLWLSLTLSIYWLTQRIYHHYGQIPLLNPVLFSMLCLVILLQLTHTPYQTYFNGAQFVHFLLGPTTVALAIPLYQYYDRLKQHWFPLLLTLVIGSTTAILSVWALGFLTGLSQTSLLSMLPKSITTPIAMGIAQEIGGEPSLTAVLVILTGIVGAVTAPALLHIVRIEDNSVRGFAIGLASHGIGTARALQIHTEMGAFAGLAMGLNGISTAILVPLFVSVLL
ncbi:LrgB family protein [Beggiatoa leptomitoformis]|uniref:LrgB family protein n=1 Tax=Beggiatoa leptomitoformis TaxID=288004 RepID=A0A2N9YII8_9GAMM|nr:LrgB family protein [Beggiatoa leptomitoformis]ALG67725.1 LrgB family protein [Beggiatoa leptomitoformis]AUI70036.1 LrgB family protein [Beggiatoa leptomitoformis]